MTTVKTKLISTFEKEILNDDEARTAILIVEECKTLAELLMRVNPVVVGALLYHGLITINEPSVELSDFGKSTAIAIKKVNGYRNE